MKPAGGSPDRIGKSFQKRADSAAFFEAWVGAVLARKGLYTIHHPFTLASETGNPVGFYAHSWDLDVSPDSFLCTPCEVKSVNLTFTCPDDYPHQGMLVCSASSWDKKWPGATATQRDFLTVSRETGGIIWLPKGSATVRKEATDKKRGETYECIGTPRSCLRPLGDFVSYIKGEPWK